MNMKKHLVQRTLLPVNTPIKGTHERNNIKPSSFQYNRRKLRMYYKLLKVGMIKAEEVPAKFRGLLIRYYGLPEDFWGKR